jgi:hypothetical protein
MLKLLHGRETKRRPHPNGGKAEVWWEETDICTTRAVGVGGQARGKRFAEIKSGTSHGQPGLTATGKDGLTEETQAGRDDGMGA